VSKEPSSWTQGREMILRSEIDVAIVSKEMGSWTLRWFAVRAVRA
jgi:hypothetical protein